MNNLDPKAQAQLDARVEAIAAITNSTHYAVVAFNNQTQEVALLSNMGKRAAEFLREAADKLEGKYA